MNAGRSACPDHWSLTSGYPYAFGGDGTGTGIDLTEPHQFLDLLEDLGIRLVNITAGSPYYNPHVQRPALFPPSDGYQPPEDPLVGVARQIGVTAELKANTPTCCWSAPATRTCRNGCRTWRKTSSAPAKPISWAWDAWC